MKFEPIAIVGQACVLPGALTPEALWEAVVEGRDLTSRVQPGEWGIPVEDALGGEFGEGERAACDVGGYVRGFEDVFDPRGFDLDPALVAELEVGSQWLLHAGREALRSAGGVDVATAGVIIGNLSFPTRAMADYGARKWVGDPLADAVGIPKGDPRHRFMSGLPARTLANGLGLGGPAYAIDAACASSLYAIGLACEALHDREVDAMLAGALCASDDLFLHVGFSALNALSESGVSRPFGANADGLIPSTGAGLVVLKRLKDAVKNNDRVLGVIRGVGLSNDGRQGGFLAPAKEGQICAMEAAYAQAGMKPGDVSLLECHATGTLVGDRTELESSAHVFKDNEDLGIGSLKSNLGHLITVAGVAGLIKVLGAMGHRIKPPSIHAESPSEALSNSPFQLVSAPEPWAPEGLRRAGVSAFGFGGNNAHLIVEEFEADYHSGLLLASVDSRVKPGEVAITGLGGVVGNAPSMRAFEEGMRCEPAVCSPRGSSLTMDIREVRFPPRDLEATLPQQVYLLQAALESLRHLPEFNHARCGVFVGMGCDLQVARYGTRWRLGEWAKAWGHLDPGEVRRLQNKTVAPLTSAGVLGTMPNVVANRLNAQFDFRGKSFSVSGEERSGLIALRLAARALRAGELDTAVVGAVDFASDPQNEEALRELGIVRRGGDAALVVVLERTADAEARGTPVLAEVQVECGAGSGVPGSLEKPSALEERFGNAHAAAGLVQLVSEALPLRRGDSGEARRLEVSGLEGGVSAVTLRPHASSREFSLPPTPSTPGPCLRIPAHGEWIGPADFNSRNISSVGSRSLPARRVEEKSMSFEETTSQEGTREMTPAPTLPPVGTMHVPSKAPLSVAEPAGEVRRTVVHVPSKARLRVPDSTGEVRRAGVTNKVTPALSELLRAHVDSVSGVHKEFIRHQVDAERRFLRLRARGAEALFEGLASGGAPSRVRTVVQKSSPPLVSVPEEKAENPPPLAVKAAATEVVARPAPEAVEQPVVLTPAPVMLAPVAASTPSRPGPKFSREELMVHAGGKISEIYGPQFKGQDPYVRQVRMPLPPLLLADRVTGLDATPRSMGTGVIWTETDVTADAWYLHDGRMPAGVMIEAGQADLMLISYLGIDFLNKGDRVYRLLGCELTYHSHLPTPGETLEFEIHGDGHATQGDVQLFFFHYQCQVNGEPRLSVREGQAGFFSEEDLEKSMGILWDPREATPCEDPRLAPPSVAKVPASLDRKALNAFADGKLYECFGEGFELGCTHTRTPRIAGGRMLFLDEVTEMTVSGGPWGRGYLRGTQAISPADWFFDGHFMNDPCMPGTLMFEGCLQTMAIYMAGRGMTLDLDGWIFEPVPEEAFELRCRGQVLPTAREVVYEVFVEEVLDGPYPTLYADLLCTVDGLKAFHCKRMGLRLVPDWPLEEKLLAMGWSESERPAAVVGEHTFNHRSLLACAFGKPSEAFGPIYDVFDSPRRVARLPGPPYHFMSRIVNINGTIGKFAPGDSVEVEYDIPADAWYLRENGAPTMPFCVLLEAALQPCGWLASFVGSALGTKEDLFFRNLDGNGTLHRELTGTSGRLLTRVSILDQSIFSGMIIESFRVECLLDQEVVYEMDTTFGFFPKEALAAQKGLPIPEREEGALELPCDYRVDLKERPEKYCGSTARLPTPFLTMIDRVTGYWPEGGEFGQGRFRSEQDVDPDAWYFKAHFFQDPVQPGSLGIEAMISLLQFAMLEMNLDAGMSAPRFEPIALGEELTWKYRGQVRPWNKQVSVILDIEETGTDELGVYARAKASLWADGLRLYEAANLGMRIVEGDGPLEILDPEKDRWLKDHRPTWTSPVLPMMSMVDRLAGAACLTEPGRRLTGLTNVQVRRWLPVTGPTTLETRSERTDQGVEAVLFNQEGEIASGSLVFREEFKPGPKPWSPVAGEEVESPYQSGALFHGEAFQLQQSLRMGDSGSSSLLNAAGTEVPLGTLNQALLDAATHGIPHDRLDKWCPELDGSEVAYPALIPEMEFFSEPPTEGEVRCEVRFDGFFGSKRFPSFRIQMSTDQGVWVEFKLVEALFPKGPLGAAAPRDRRRFMEERCFVPGLSLSELKGEGATLSEASVRGSNWLEGTLEEVYGVTEQDGTLVSQIATLEAKAHRVGLHPSRVERGLPLTRWSAAVEEDDAGVSVRGLQERLNIDVVKEYWAGFFNQGRWPVEDLYYGLIERFVRRVVIEDPEGWEAARGQGVLYLANHQVGIESLLFSVVASALAGRPTVTLAKAEHRDSWLGNLIRHNFTYPGVEDPGLITYFERDDKASLPVIIAELAADMKNEGKGVMVHVEGTRSLSCSAGVTKMSGAFIDMALGADVPIVPVRFKGGLPKELLPERLEFPVGMGAQEYWLGAPLWPKDLKDLPYGERKKKVMAAINGLGGSNGVEEPALGDGEFERGVLELSELNGVSLENATLCRVLAEGGELCDETSELLSGEVSADHGDSKRAWLGQLTRQLRGEQESRFER